MSLRATDIFIDSDEDGWHLIVTDEDDEQIDFNIHGVVEQLMEQLPPLTQYWREGVTVRREYEAAKREGRTALDEIERLHDEHTAQLLTPREDR